jgi:DinB superfamily
MTELFQRELRLNGLMHIVLMKLLNEAGDAELSEPIAEGGNPPAFILGHLAVAYDYALRNLGEPRVAPAEWHKRFRPGASPKDDTSPLPTKSELLAALETGRQRMVEAAAKADPERLNQPNNVEFFKGTPVQTVGDMVAHLLTTHPFFHMGQLSAWRRSKGKPFLF